jgi:hypothetical protein
MKIIINIFFTFSLLLIIAEVTNAQIKTNINQADSITLYQYDYYDKDGNNHYSIEAPTPELRYECPICKGASRLYIRNNNYSVPVNAVPCWRCNGKGYLVSNSGKKK